jgi:hypothetical protein
MVAVAVSGASGNRTIEVTVDGAFLGRAFAAGDDQRARFRRQHRRRRAHGERRQLRGARGNAFRLSRAHRI